MRLRKTIGLMALVLSAGLEGGVAVGGFVDEFTDKDELESRDSYHFLDDREGMQ